MSYFVLFLFFVWISTGDAHRKSQKMNGNSFIEIVNGKVFYHQRGQYLGHEKFTVYRQVHAVKVYAPYTNCRVQ